jgi:DNA-binding NarL/FixJ family response regulator
MPQEISVARHVLILDDHPFVHSALVNLLRELEPGAQVTLTHRLTQAVAALRGSPAPDLILADLHLADANGPEVVNTLRRQRPECPIAIFSASEDTPMIRRCLEAGAIGYIPKTHSSEATLNALRLITTGCPYLPPQLLNERHGGQRNLDGTAESFFPGLTARQVDVLRLIVRGLPNKLICRQLQLAEGTVKVHVSAILRALGVRTRTQAVIAANRLGLDSHD